jgi:hypothetical protein
MLARRIADLEEALRGFADSHTLLSNELLALKEPFLRRGSLQSTFTNGSPPPADPVETKKEEDELIQAVGSLALTETGRTRYMGPSVTPWLLILVSISVYFTRRS